MIPSAPELGTLWAQSFWSRIAFGRSYFNLGREAGAPESRHQGPLDLVQVFASMERACEPPQLAGGDNLLDELRAECVGFSIDRLGRFDDEPDGLMRRERQPLWQQCGVEPDGVGRRRSLTVFPSLEHP